MIKKHRRFVKDNERTLLIALFAAVIAVMGVFRVLSTDKKFDQHPAGTYEPLSPDTNTEDPLKYIDEDFAVKDGFHTNLPIVILKLDSDIPDYKTFKYSSEMIIEGVEPYTTGSMRIIDTGTGINTLDDPADYQSSIRIKAKGHSSYLYDKKQYKIKALNKDGTSNKTDILGMGEGSEWIINGSMADKSMIRNYLSYRIASEIDGNNMSPDSRYCEVLMEKEDGLYYQGVFLLMETVDQGKDRVHIDKYKPKNIQSSYIVRRDRLTSFDIMLKTYGRENISENELESLPTDNWIGLKYPAASKVTDQTIEYITKDFSKIEKVIYSKNESIFRMYDKYIDVDSFVDYFLINEFFGNYDAGEHSTYMYKNTGDVLCMGPVWDYDQALNNSPFEELDTENIAFQTQTFYAELCNDKKFIRKLKTRYSKLRERSLSEEHIFNVIDETVSYLKSAQEREWYRWAADYYDDSNKNAGNFQLQSYIRDGVLLKRFNDEYTEEIYVIKKYISEHGSVIKNDLKKWEGTAKLDTTTGGLPALLFLAMMSLLLLPSYLISRKG